MHIRFPYSVVGTLFAMPQAADEDQTVQRTFSTFERARVLLGTISGREDYSSPGEKFEDIVMMLFSPSTDQAPEPSIQLFLATARQGVRHELSELEYFERIRDIYNIRNPHAQVGGEIFDEDRE